MNKHTHIILIFISCLLIFSCQKEKEENYEGLSVILGNEKNASATITIDMNGDWEIWNTSDWYTVSDEYGSGSSDITVTTLSENEDLKERVATLTVVSAGGNQKTYHIIQRGSLGIDSYKGTYGSYAEKGTLIIKLKGNVRNENLEVVPSEEWIKFKELRQGKKEILSDDITESLYGDIELVFDMEANVSSDFRTSDIEINIEDKKYFFQIIQICPSDIDFNKSFYKNTLIAKYTATSCVYCPGMERILEQVISEIPDRIIPLNIHPMHSEGGLGFEGTEQLMKKFNVDGYPTAFANYVAKINNSAYDENVKTAFEDITKESYCSYPAKTAISVSSETDGTKLNVDIEIAMKEALEYKITIYVLEDGIIYKQLDGDELVIKYEHNHILRDAISDVMGDNLPFSIDKGICRMRYSTDIPDNLKNKDNAYLLIYVTYPGSPEIKTAKYVTYMDFGLIVDNVVTVGLNDKTEYRYE